MPQPTHDRARRAAATLAHALRSLGGRSLPAWDADIHPRDVSRLRRSAAPDAPDPFLAACHPVNVIGDGSLLDANADRFREGHRIRVIHPGDGDYCRFRPRFTADRHPGNSPAEFAGLAGEWAGVADEVVEARRRDRGGPFWWLADLRAIAASSPPSLAHVRGLDRPR